MSDDDCVETNRSAEPSVPTIVGELIADSRAGQAVVGVRGGPAAGWAMSFRGGLYDVVLDLEPRAAWTRVNGRLIGPDSTAGCDVRVARGDELVAIRSADSSGEFELGALPPDEYVLSIVLTDQVIKVDVELPGRPSR